MGQSKTKRKKFPEKNFELVPKLRCRISNRDKDTPKIYHTTYL